MVAGEFVGFYDGNPNFERNWDLTAEKIAIVGVGNVALDIARVLAKTADELKVTEIPDNVYDNLNASAAKEIHVFGRRGPAQAKFSPLELKELDHSDTIEVIVDPEDIDYDEASEQARREAKSVDLVCQTLEGYAMRDPKGAPHKLFIHFFESPVEILGGEDGKVTGFVTERTELDGKGGVTLTGKTTTWDVQAVYRAVGYRSDAVKGVPFDDLRAVIPNDEGHVLTEFGGDIVPGLYATGWIKRGPIGLIGNTKSDAKDTTTMLLEDFTMRPPHPHHPPRRPGHPRPARRQGHQGDHLGRLAQPRRRRTLPRRSRRPRTQEDRRVGRHGQRLPPGVKHQNPTPPRAPGPATV